MADRWVSPAPPEGPAAPDAVPVEDTAVGAEGKEGHRGRGRRPLSTHFLGVPLPDVYLTMAEATVRCGAPSLVPRCADFVSVGFLGFRWFRTNGTHAMYL